MKKYGYLATLALTAMLVACNGQEEAVTQQPSGSSASEVQTTAEEKIVTDQLGREVTIPEKIERVVTGGFYRTFPHGMSRQTRQKK